MNSDTKTRLFWGGCAASVIGYGYGVYRLPKLDEHFKFEGLCVVGAFLGGAYITLTNEGFCGGMSDGCNATKNVPMTILGSTMFFGSVSYVICRNLVKKNPKQALAISAIVGLAASVALFHQDLGIGKPVATPSGKDSAIIKK